MERERHDVLHQEILRRMENLGGSSPAAFCDVMEQDPELLVRYMRTCGLDAKSAVIESSLCDLDQLTVKVTETDGSKVGCVIHFLAFE